MGVKGMQKGAIELIACILAFGMIFTGTTRVFQMKQLEEPWDMTRKVEGIKNEQEDSVDVMYFGSSHMYTSINPVVVWEERGIPSYILATQKQPFWISYYYMREALKYQKPKVVVLDIYRSDFLEEYEEESVNRAAIDLLSFSYNKSQMIEASVPKEERASYYVNLIKYHGRWKELTKEDFDWSYLKRQDPLKGYVCLYPTTPIKTRESLEGVTKVSAMSDKTENYLMKIIELAKLKDFQLVLYKAPSNATKEQKAYYNAVEAIAKKHNIHFIDYNMRYDEVGLDLNQDFYDANHLNLLGANKVSKHFSAYLAKEFQLEDKRNEESYQEAWHKASEINSRWQMAYELRHITDFKAYMEATMKEGYVVLLTTVSDTSLDTISEEGLKNCQSFGFLQKQPLKGHYIALIEDGQLPYEVDRAQLNASLSQIGLPIETTYDESERYTLSQIEYKKHNYFTPRGNMNMIVYDKKLDKIVSNVLVDLKTQGKIVQ